MGEFVAEPWLAKVLLKDISGIVQASKPVLSI